MKTWWQREGYLYGRELEQDGLWIVVIQMLFTYRVALCTERGILEFYCYEDYASAAAASVTWDGGADNPMPGWTRHHKLGGDQA